MFKLILIIKLRQKTKEKIVEKSEKNRVKFIEKIRLKKEV